jgi:hypothetical protein
MINKNINILFLLFFLLLTSHFSLLNAQAVFVPINDNIYSYLDRMNIKGVIKLDSEVKPFSKIYIAKKLVEIDSKKTDNIGLTNVDLDLLDFYKAEYIHSIRFSFSPLTSHVSRPFFHLCLKRSLRSYSPLKLR